MLVGSCFSEWFKVACKERERENKKEKSEDKNPNLREEYHQLHRILHIPNILNSSLISSSCKQ